MSIAPCIIFVLRLETVFSTCLECEFEISVKFVIQCALKGLQNQPTNADVPSLQRKFLEKHFQIPSPKFFYRKK
jgi:hypothetical protein